MLRASRACWVSTRWRSAALPNGAAGGASAEPDAPDAGTELGPPAGAELGHPGVLPRLTASLAAAAAACHRLAPRSSSDGPRLRSLVRSYVCSSHSGGSDSVFHFPCIDSGIFGPIATNGQHGEHGRDMT